MTHENPQAGTGRRAFPKLCIHKPSRRFYIDWQGRFHYWPTGTTRSVAQADYDAMRSAHEAGEAFVFRAAQRAPVRSVDALIDAYLSHCDRYYANSKATPLHEQFGRRPLDTFGPRLLSDVREGMLATGWSRKVINARVQCIVRMFKWAVAKELVSSSVYESLRALEGLRLGRTEAPEGPGRRPVPWEHVEPVLAHVSREIAAMLVVQADSGARPGEVVQMRPMDIDREGRVWTFKPERHKTQHLGKTRLIPLFAEAQRAIEPFLCRVPPPPVDQPLFSPQRAEGARSVVRRRVRRTRVQPSQAARQAVALETRGRPPREGYDVNTYARAVRRGIDAANAAIGREAILSAVAPLVPEGARVLVVGRLTSLPDCAIPFAPDGSVERDRQVARLRKRLERIAARAARRGAKCDPAELVQAALAAADAVRSRMVPYWSPYQLRHRFATEGERRFGQAAVSLAMGHASLRMTEHYIERNMKAVFERMAEQG
jgi:integrase